MASIKNVVAGLEILAKTASVPKALANNGETDRRTAHLGGAEHDIIFGPESCPTEDDAIYLNELGWHFSDEHDVWAIFV